MARLADARPGAVSALNNAPDASRVTHRGPGLQRRPEAPLASSPAPEGAPDQPLLPYELLGSSLGGLGHRETQGMVLAVTGFCHKQRQLQERGSCTHATGGTPPLWPRSPLGSSGRSQGQRPRQESPHPKSANLMSLPAQLDVLQPVLLAGRVRNADSGLPGAAEGRWPCHKDSCAQSGVASGTLSPGTQDKEDVWQAQGEREATSASQLHANWSRFQQVCLGL